MKSNRSMLILGCLVAMAGAVPGHGQGRRQGAASLFSARRAFDDGFYDMAARRLETWLAANPEAPGSDEARLLLGQSLLELGRAGDARTVLEESLGRPPVRRWLAATAMWAGEAARRQDAPEIAAGHYESAITAGADGRVEDRALLGLGWARLKMSKPDEALEAFRKVLRSADLSFAAEARVHVGKALVAAGRNAEAVDWFTAILDDADAAGLHVRALLWRAHALEASGDTEAALAGMKEAADRAAEGSDGDAGAAMRSEALADRADLLSRLERHEEAIADYESALEGSPDDDALCRSLVGLAQCDLKQGRVEEGLARLETFVQDHAGDALAARVGVAIADIHFEQGDYQRAGEQYASLAVLYPDSPFWPRAQFGVAWCDLLSEKYESALSGFRAVVDAPSAGALRAQAAFKIGDVYLRMGRYGAAVEAYRKIASDYPLAGLGDRALFQAAQGCSRQNDVPGAVEILRELVERFPESDFAPAAALQLARSLFSLDDYGQARTVFQEIIDAYPESPEAGDARLGLGQALYEEGDFAGAVEMFDRFLDEHADAPSAVRGRYDRAWALALGGSPDEARAAFLAFLERHGDHALAADVRLRIAEDHYNRGETADAEGLFLELVEKHPDSELADDALFVGARCASELGEHSEAARLFGRLVAEYPSSPLLEDARFWQADELTRKGMYDGALLAFQKFLSEHPSGRLSFPAVGRMGDCQYSLGRYEDAAETYTRLMASSGVSPGLRDQAEYKLGQTVEQLGRDDEAFDHYMAVVYRFFQEGYALAEGVDWLWFCRAGMAAGRLQERHERWSEAVRVYERLAGAGAPCAPQASQRIRRIRLERLLLLSPGA